jgi:hypothetical protein
LVEELLDKLTEQLDKDPYNTIENFNLYERGIRRFETFLQGYIDDDYLEARGLLDTLPLSNKKEKIIKLDCRFDLCMRLLKRKQFTPLDDVMGTSFWIVRDIVKRIQDEMDAQIIVHGLRGTGKSTLVLQLALEVAEKFNLTFNPKEHVFYSARDLMNYISDNNPKRGQPLMLDEAGASKGLGKRRHATRENIEFNECIQVIRELGLVMFYTAPFDTQLDSGTLSMFSCNIETVRLDKQEKIVSVKYKIIQGSIWVYLNDFNGGRINRILINKPPEEIIRQYKEGKANFVKVKIKPSDERKPREELKADIDKIKKLVKDNKDFMFEKVGKMRYRYEDIYKKFERDGLTLREAQDIKRDLEKEAENNGE